jgi:UTP--glucose-1-phosphate uridylyltransferase
MKKVRKAIIPAAGYGTRSLPITKVIPKELFPIGGKPAIHYIVEEAAASGIEEILMIVSRNKNLIVDYFDQSLELEAFLEKENKLHLIEEVKIPKIHIQYIRQPYANGLGGAVSLGKQFTNKEPVAVILPDDIFINNQQPGLKQLINTYETYQQSVVALKKMEEDQLKNYGVIKGKEIKERLYEMTDIVEKPLHSAPSNLAVIGRYILEPAIFSFLEKQILGAGMEIQLTDAIKNMLEVSKCYGVEIKGDRYDIGSEKDYIKIVNNFYNSSKIKT